ncbi:MAG: DUF1007 family protein [Hyphomicrobiaceae bacterium]
MTEFVTSLPAARRLACACAGLVLALAAGMAAFAAPAGAHPHVWVTMREDVVIKDGAIVALLNHWTFDKYYSEMAIDGLDTNKDGKYSKEELAELAKINIEGLKEFDYFVFPRLAGQPLKVGAPTDYWLEFGVSSVQSAEAGPAPQAANGTVPVADAADKPAAPGKVLTLHFTLPLAQPVPIDAKGFTFTVTDPTYFIAFEPARERAATLAEGAPKSCRIQATRPTEDPQDKKRAGGLMSSQSAAGDVPLVQFVSPTEWAVSCEARS